MKNRLVISTLIGSILPWLYFVFITVSPVKYISANGNVTEGSRGVAGFIEFNGLSGSLFIYLQAIIVCTVFVLIIYSIYNVINKQITKKP